MSVKSNLSEMEIYWILNNPKKESVEQLARRIKTSKNVIQKVLDDNRDSSTTVEIKPKGETSTMQQFARNKKYGFIGATQGATERADYGNPDSPERRPKKEDPSHIFRMNKE